MTVKLSFQLEYFVCGHCSKTASGQVCWWNDNPQGNPRHGYCFEKLPAGWVLFGQMHQSYCSEDCLARDLEQFGFATKR